MKTRITCQREKVSEVWDEAMPLIEQHWREVGEDEPDPDRERYAMLEANDVLRCFTARDDGRMVGYALFVIQPNLHKRGEMQAFQDVLFVHPDARGTVGVSLLKMVENELRAEGIDWVYHCVRHASRAGELLSLMGYDLINDMYRKRLWR